MPGGGYGGRLGHGYEVHGVPTPVGGPRPRDGSIGKVTRRSINRANSFDNGDLLHGAASMSGGYYTGPDAAGIGKRARVRWSWRQEAKC